MVARAITTIAEPLVQSEPTRESSAYGGPGRTMNPQGLYLPYDLLNEIAQQIAQQLPETAFFNGTTNGDPGWLLRQAGDASASVTSDGTGPVGRALRRLRDFFLDALVPRVGFAAVSEPARGDLIPEAQVATRAAATPDIEGLHWLKEATGLSHERIGHLLGVSRQTIHRWERGETIADPNHRRLLAVVGILKLAASHHPSPKELKGWLDTPRGTSGRTPADLLAAGEIDRARFFAMTVASPQVRRPPQWMREPVAESFRTQTEYEPVLSIEESPAAPHSDQPESDPMSRDAAEDA